MSEGQQEAYQHDNQSSVDQQLASSSTEQQQLSHKRKREPIEEGSPAEIDDARPGSDRRSSIKHTSPNMSAFMPINTNSPQNPYASYQPLNALQQHSPNTMNGSSSASDAANTALAATAMSSMLPSLGGMPFPQSDAGRPAEQHNMDSSFTAMSPQPVEGHTEGVGGIVHPAPRQPVQQAAPTPNPKPQVGTEEWHRVRRDNHKEGE